MLSISPATDLMLEMGSSSAALSLQSTFNTFTVELETKVAEDYAKFYNHGEGHYF